MKIITFISILLLTVNCNGPNKNTAELTKEFIIDYNKCNDFAFSNKESKDENTEYKIEKRPIQALILLNENMDIKSIKLEHTNPSLGPHEVVTTVLLTVSESNRKKTVDRFLESSQVNGTLSVHDYIKAILDKNQADLEKVAAQAPKGELNEGETISNLSFHFENGVIIEFSDVYRKYSLTHFNPEFTSFMVVQGTITSTSQNKDSLGGNELSPDFYKREKKN